MEPRLIASEKRGKPICFSSKSFCFERMRKMADIRVYNTLSQKKEDFVPLEEGRRFLLELLGNPLREVQENRTAEC